RPRPTAAGGEGPGRARDRPARDRGLSAPPRDTPPRPRGNGPAGSTPGRARRGIRRCPLLFAQDRDRLDLDEQVVSDQARDLDEGAGGTVRAEVFLAGDVDLLAIGDVLEDHGDLAHVSERGAGGREAALEILVDLPGLRGGVVAADGASLGIGRDAARDEHEAAGAHDVGEVTDGLGHSGDSNLFAPTDSVHGPPRLDVRPVSLGEARRDRAGRSRSAVRSPASTELYITMRAGRKTRGYLAAAISSMRPDESPSRASRRRPRRMSSAISSAARPVRRARRA